MRWPEIEVLCPDGRREPINRANMRKLERAAAGDEGPEGVQLVLDLLLKGHAKCPRGNGEAWTR